MDFTFDSTYSIGDIIAIVTTFITFITVIIMVNGNRQNARQSQLQSVENTIIKQLEFHYDLVNRMKLNLEEMGGGFGSSSISPIITGSDTFEEFYRIFKDKYSKLPLLNVRNKVISEEQKICEAFGSLYNMYGTQIGNYFKNLYLLFRYIDEKKKELKGFDGDHYVKLVKSQLSKYEILLLAYNCIWLQDKPHGKRFIDLASKHKILSALETDELIHSENISHPEIFERKYGIEFG